MLIIKNLNLISFQSWTNCSLTPTATSFPGSLFQSRSERDRVSPFPGRPSDLVSMETTRPRPQGDLFPNNDHGNDVSMYGLMW